MTITTEYNAQSRQVKAYENGQLVYSPYAARIESNGPKTPAEVKEALNAIPRIKAGAPFSFNEIKQFEGNLGLFKIPSKPQI